jgi:putative ABC transport system permease protein
MSFLWLTILSALRILRRNPLRAGLTMLGIIIGIGAVVAMVSLGQGATASVQAEISSLGTNVLIIVPGATTVGGVRGGLGTISTLTVDDAEDIEKKVASVTTVMYATRSVLQVIRENKNWSTIVLGTTPEFTDIRSWPIAQGNFFTQSDMDSAAKVAVLGKTAVQNLFEPGEEVVGSQIRIRNVPLRVIGVLAPKGAIHLGPGPRRSGDCPILNRRTKSLGHTVSRNGRYHPCGHTDSVSDSDGRGRHQGTFANPASHPPIG